MKRDCGKGELIPIRFVIKYCPTKADKELSRLATGLNDPAYEAIQQTLVPYGNVRLYACDKAGYCNCIRSTHCSPTGELSHSTDRRTELQLKEVN